MQIRWLGHACFLIETSEGTRVLTDPFNKQVGYPVPAGVKADVVTVSHEHFDHNAVEVVRGTPKVIRQPGKHIIKGITIKGISSYHDNAGGKQRGENNIFVMEIDGIKVCHLGDLGHLLNHEQLNAIGQVNVLLIPVGGHFTIDASEAYEQTCKINPHLVIPMHYKTKYITFPIGPVDKFTKHFSDVKHAASLEINKNTLPEPMQAAVLDLANSKEL